jgi:hypothetical protein
VVIFTTFLNLVFLSLLSWWVWRKETSTIRKFYWPALITKLLCGLLLGLLYKIYYSANDTFYFFDSAIVLSKQVQSDFWEYLRYLFSVHEGFFLGEARTLFFIKITSVIALFTAGNYWVASLYFSLLSFFGAWRLTRVLSLKIPKVQIPAVVALLFFPSVVFWSSGIIKEALAMAALFYVTAFFIQLWFKERVSLISIVGAIISIWVIWNLKYYYVGVFIPVVFTAWAVNQLSTYYAFQKFTTEFLVFVIMLIAGLGLAGLAHPNLNVSRFAEVIISNNEAFMQVSSHNDVIHFYNLKGTWFSVLINSLWALFSGLFRPFLWEANSGMQVIAAIENLLLLILSIGSFRCWQNLPRSPYRLLVVAVVVYCTLLCVFLALSSPNFGTLSRYRVGFLPFLVLLVANHPFVVRRISKLW